MKSKSYNKLNLIKKNHFKLEIKVENLISYFIDGKHRNLYPDIECFEKNTLEFYDSLHQLNLKLLECICIGLDIDD